MAHRRDLLTGLVMAGVTGAVALPVRSKAQPAASPRTFVLLHGAQHGGWCWVRVAERLQASGHRVFTPTLAGLGDRSHLLSRETSLEMHVQDILSLLRWERLKNVTLVAHSYGGMVATVVADRAGDAIGHLVYVDGLVPQDGESWKDLHTPAVQAAVTKGIEGPGEGWKIPVAPASAFGITDPADQAWINGLLTPQPGRTYTDTVRLGRMTENVQPRLYVSCTAPKLSSLDIVKSRIRAATGWKFEEITAGHDAMVIAPDKLAQLLLES